MSDIDYEKLAQVIAKAVTTGGTGNSIPVGRAYAGGTDEASVKQTIADLKKQHDSFSKWNSVLKKGHLQYADVTEQLKKFDDEIEKATDSAKQAELVARKTELAEKAREANRNTALYNSLSVLNKATGSVLGLGNSAVSAAGNLTKSFLNGASGVQFSTEIMTAGLDLAGQASQVTGQAVTGVGAAMAQGTGKVKGFGIALEVAGSALGLVGEGASKFLKFGVEILSKEVEKTVKAFNTVSASGAVFANGMTGMRDAAGAAGLTVDQFATVIQQNSASLAGAGLSVAEGAKRVGGALTVGGTKMKQELLNLGYGFEEQAGLVAETISRMKGSGVGPLAVSNKQVAEQTQKYADNLRIIAAITGEDAKAKMKQVQEQANQLAFQQKIAGLSAAEQDNIKQGMANMSDVQRKNFMDMVNFGTVVNQEGAAFQALSGGMTAAVNRSYNDFLNHSLSAESERANIAANGAQIQKDMLANTAIGLAGAANVGGIAQGLAESMGKELEFRKIWNAEAQANAVAGVAAQKTTADKLTEIVTGNEVVMQNFRTQVQTLLTGPMGQFSDVMSQTLDAMRTVLGEAGFKSDTKESSKPGWWARNGMATLDYAGTALGTAGGALAGGLAGFGVGAIPAAYAGAVGGHELGVAIAASLGLKPNDPGKANGGISSGPTSGFLEKLHGTELVLPLTAQGTIKEGTQGHADLMSIMGNLASDQHVNITQQTKQEPASTQIIEKVQNLDVLADALASLISTARDQLDKQDEMLRAMQDTKDYTERLYHSMS
jgi:hypothetical protein